MNVLSLNNINHIRLTAMISFSHASQSHTTQDLDAIFDIDRCGYFFLFFRLMLLEPVNPSAFAQYDQILPRICFLLRLTSSSFFSSPSLLPPFQLSIQARLEVVKRATKALRQLGEKSRKRGGDGCGEQDGTDPAGMTFDEALTHLQQSQAHLDTLSHAFILSLKESQQVDSQAVFLKRVNILLL